MDGNKNRTKYTFDAGGRITGIGKADGSGRTAKAEPSTKERRLWQEEALNPDCLSAQGYAPKVSRTQSVGKNSSYVLHHKNPIHNGGEVYNLDNIVLVTPRMHSEILDAIFHYNR